MKVIVSQIGRAPATFDVQDGSTYMEVLRCARGSGLVGADVSITVASTLTSGALYVPESAYNDQVMLLYFLPRVYSSYTVNTPCNTVVRCHVLCAGNRLVIAQ